jgi:hypothetical protein
MLDSRTGIYLTASSTRSESVAGEPGGNLIALRIDERDPCADDLNEPNQKVMTALCASPIIPVTACSIRLATSA